MGELLRSRNSAIGCVKGPFVRAHVLTIGFADEWPFSLHLSRLAAPRDELYEKSGLAGVIRSIRRGRPLVHRAGRAAI